MGFLLISQPVVEASIQAKAKTGALFILIHSLGVAKNQLAFSGFLHFAALLARLMVGQLLVAIRESIFDR